MPTENIMVIDEPFIWIGSINEKNTVIELSKVTHQQYFLISKDSSPLVGYFQKIDEAEVRIIGLASKAFPYSKLDDLDLLFINLN